MLSSYEAYPSKEFRPLASYTSQPNGLPSSLRHLHSALHSYQSSASHIFLLKFCHYFTFFLPGPLIHSISFSSLTSSFYFLFFCPIFSLFLHLNASVFVYYFLFLFQNFPCFLVFIILISSYVFNFELLSILQYCTQHITMNFAPS